MERVISIHPPRVGWDSSFSIRPLSLYIFQSTHPVWGGTAKINKLSCNILSIFIHSLYFILYLRTIFRTIFYFIPLFYSFFAEIFLKISANLPENLCSLAVRKNSVTIYVTYLISFAESYNYHPSITSGSKSGRLSTTML